MRWIILYQTTTGQLVFTEAKSRARLNGAMSLLNRKEFPFLVEELTD